MINYFIYKNSTGEIVSTGSRPDRDLENIYVPERCSLGEGVASKRIDRFDLVDGRVVPLPPKPDGVATFDYGTLSWVVDSIETVKRTRELEYPPIGDQLDALWKLIQANSDKIDLGEAAPLLAAVREVKDKYPKE